ncbi:phosphotransferase [Novosphingobium sp. M1R2S20]|uniref:Phosphotransferase n=1 Tax=Novosphingobium rhizovicinum TaxID=3228928 RepID=A0ABV3REC2_9SPHN
MSSAQEQCTQASLPMTLGQIDAAWLTSALRTRFPDVRVRQLTIAEVMHGTCTKVWIDLETDGAQLPGRLMLKGGFEPHSRDWWSMHQMEVGGYLHILPELRLPSPTCYFAAYDEGQKQGVIVMEDLVSSGARFCHAQHPAGLTETRQRLATLAAFHARSWQSESFAPGGDWHWVQDVACDTRDYARAFLQPEVWTRYTALPRGAAVARRFHDAAWLGEALEKLVTVSSSLPHCVLHGDTHPGNLYVAADGTPGFFDSLPGHGPAMSEVAYHLVCALDVEDRRSWERELVRFYLDALASQGVEPPTEEEAMTQYAIFLARAYFIFIINASEFQKEAVNTAYTARISAAMLDHDTAGRLSAL